MTDARFAEVRRLFESLLDLPAEERASRLRETAGDDGDLCRAVEEMLAAHESADGFLTVAADRDVGGYLATGTRVDGFTVVRALGEGGMGAVYVARQADPDRLVAIKTMAGSRTAELARRFRDEIEILARLRHPAIAQVLQAGSWTSPAGEVVPYFAMELVDDARSILEFARGEDVTRAELLAMFVEVCEAVQYGHGRGVIHRDLKPANILVDPGGRPKVIDFGVARLVSRADDDLDRTRPGQLIGTPRYMSPEQIGANPDDVDVRTDVYSLGVVLFELLAGESPYDLRGLSLSAASRVIQEVEPFRVTTIRPDVPAELDWICARALEKEPQRRYAGAAELAADLRRFQSGLPVSVGPPGPLYRWRKYAARNRALVAALALLALSLVGGVGFGAFHFVRAERNLRAKLDEQMAGLETLRFVREVMFAASPELLGPDVTLREVLAQTVRDLEREPLTVASVDADVRQLIGTIYNNLGRYEEAEEQLQRAFEHRDADGDPEALASICFELGRVAAARLRHGEATEWFDRSLRELHRHDPAADDLYCRNARAMALAALGQDDEALAELEDVLRARRSAGAPDLLLSLNALAEFHLNRRSLEEAQAFVGEAMATELVRGSPDHPEALRARFDAGALCALRGDHRAAIEQLGQTVRDAERVFATNDARVIGARGRLACSLLAVGDHSRAREEFEHVLAVQGAPRSMAVELAGFRSYYAQALAAGGDVAEAERQVKRSYDEVAEAVGRDHPLASHAASLVAGFLEACGRPADAQRWREAAGRPVEEP